MKNKLRLLLVLTIIVGEIKAQTYVPALITSSQVWDLNGSPYIIGQNTYLDTGVSVIVLPGVEVKATGMYKISINGEFQAKGKWDSVIAITGVDFDFSSKSKDYNSLTGKGAYLNYCNFTGMISNTHTNMKVDNCVFTFTSDVFYIGGYDTTIIEISNSKFLGKKNSAGSPIYIYNFAAKTTVTNCYFYEGYDLHVYGTMVFKNNTFNKINTTYLFIYGNSEFSCNRFYNMDILNLYLYENNGKSKFIFNNNTLDSIGTNSSAAMMNITRNASNSKQYGSIEINNNNFLKYKGLIGGKLLINGTNQSPMKTDTINFKSNYWGTNDSATITTLIKDYTDDINIYRQVDFSGFKLAPISSCSYNNKCPNVDFNYTIKDSTVSFGDNSTGSTPYKVKWYFGDGNKDVSNTKKLSHSYEKAGKYMACFVVTDSLGVVCDSVCKVIEIVSNSKCNADFYFAVDTSDTKIIYIANTSKGTNSKTKYYWTFGDGAGSSAKNPTHTYGKTGKFQVCLTIFDTLAGCYSTYCDFVDLNSAGIELKVIDHTFILNINSQSKQLGFSVSPNPSAGVFVLSLNSKESTEYQVAVLNSIGQVIQVKNQLVFKGNNSFNFDLGNFENGVYFIRVQNENHSGLLKVILNK